MQCTPSLPSLPGPLWHRVVELSEFSAGVQTDELCKIELLEIELFDHFTVCINKMCWEII